MDYKVVYPVEIMMGFSSSDSYVLMLMEPSEGKRVPMVIGEHEAQAIILAQDGSETKRPMTHQLLCNIFQEYLLTLNRVTIDKFEEGVFYATLHISDGFSVKKIDSRSSDAIALALMMGCDIEMNSKILEETAVESDNIEEGYRPEQHKPTLEELKEQLAVAEANEEFEKAAELQKKIELWTKE